MVQQRSHFVKTTIPFVIGTLMLLLCVGTAIAQGPIASQNYDLSYAKGLVAFDSERYKKAEALFRSALEGKPGDPDASYYLGQTLIRAKKYQAAEAVFQTMLDADPTAGRAWLGLGIVHYNKEAYQAALTSLAAAEDWLPADPLVPYYQGLAYHQQKAFEQSLDRFSRVLTLRTNLAPAAHYYRGIAYFRRGFLEKAQPEFEAVIQADPMSALAKSAKNFLLISEEGVDEEPKWWNLQMSVGSQYDSNVVLLPTGSSPPGGTTGISDESDYAILLYARGEVRAQQTQAWSIGASYGLVQSLHQDLTAFDVQAHSPTGFVQYQKGPVFARLNLIYDIVYVGQEPYLHAPAVRPVLTFSEGKLGFTRFEIGYQNKTFRNARFDGNTFRNGKNWRVGATQYLLFAYGKGHARLGYTFDANITGGGSPATATPGTASSADWAYLGHRLTIGLGVPPFHGTIFDLGFEYYRQDYDNPNSFATSGTVFREDNVYSFTGTASRKITSYLSAVFQYTYIRDNANVSVFDYSRSIFSLTLTGTFDGQF